ncbi:hypothetical protein E2C01_025684 [Portunus trituberculatus]|uniref:Uncharacterized protein n=1 Tax=Portunus trituberculatus TaxID=210409 RepID=A0A5B7EIL3_PORTR|nr:hypothetical protein [Portunus trituberculatus]
MPPFLLHIWLRLPGSGRERTPSLYQENSSSCKGARAVLHTMEEPLPRARPPPQASRSGLAQPDAQ